MINPLLYKNVRKIIVKEATIYKSQVGDTMNAQINQTRLYPINHISWSGIKRALLHNFFYALLMNFMYFCEVAKLSAWQMFSRDEKPQGSFISLVCWWLQESIAWKFQCLISRMTLIFLATNVMIFNKNMIFIGKIYGGKSLWIVTNF